MITRRAFTATLSLTGLSLLAGFSPLRLITNAMAQGADVAKPQSLPDMALGPANASVTITEYASMTCPHCAPHWRGSAPRSSEIEPFAQLARRNPPLPQLAFPASEGFFSYFFRA